MTENIHEQLAALSLDQVLFQVDPSTYLYNSRRLKTLMQGHLPGPSSTVLMADSVEELRVDQELVAYNLLLQGKKTAREETGAFLVDQSSQLSYLYPSLSAQLLLEAQTKRRAVHLIEPCDVFFRVLLGSVLPLDTLQAFFAQTLAYARETKTLKQGYLRNLSIHLLNDVYYKNKDLLLLSTVESILKKKKGKTAVVLEMSHLYSLAMMMDIREREREEKIKQPSLKYEHVH